MTALGLALGHARSGARGRALAALAFAIVGFGLVYLAGFAHSNALHNAAHDTRHSITFPCH